MKKTLTLTSLVLVALCCFTACGTKTASKSPSQVRAAFEARGFTVTEHSIDSYNKSFGLNTDNKMGLNTDNNSGLNIGSGTGMDNSKNGDFQNRHPYMRGRGINNGSMNNNAIGGNNGVSGGTNSTDNAGNINSDNTINRRIPGTSRSFPGGVYIPEAGENTNDSSNVTYGGTANNRNTANNTLNRGVIGNDNRGTFDNRMDNNGTIGNNIENNRGTIGDNTNRGTIGNSGRNDLNAPNTDNNNNLNNANTNNNVSSGTVLVATKGSERITIFFYDDMNGATNHNDNMRNIGNNNMSTSDNNMTRKGNIVFSGTDEAVKILKSII